MAYVADFQEHIWSCFIWNKNTPYRVNASMRRVFQNALPADDNIQRKGISLSSCCVCCMVPSHETLEHLLIKSELAYSVWHFFGSRLQKLHVIHSVSHVINTWMNGTRMRSQLGLNDSWHCFLWFIGDMEASVPS